METLAFTIWMIGWPFVCSYSRINRRAVGIDDTAGTVLWTSVIELAT